MANKKPKFAQAIWAFTGGDPGVDIGEAIGSLKRAHQDGGLPTLLWVPKSSSFAGGYFANEEICSFVMMVRSHVSTKDVVTPLLTKLSLLSSTSTSEGIGLQESPQPRPSLGESLSSGTRFPLILQGSASKQPSSPSRKASECSTLLLKIGGIWTLPKVRGRKGALAMV